MKLGISSVLKVVSETPPVAYQDWVLSPLRKDLSSGIYFYGPPTLGYFDVDSKSGDLDFGQHFYNVVI